MRGMFVLGFASLLLVVPMVVRAAAPKAGVGEQTVKQVVAELIAEHGEGQADRIRRGVGQVAARWWERDGDEQAFRAFCLEHFMADEAELARISSRLEAVLEQIDGHLHEVRREITRPLDLDLGPVAEVDRMLAEVDFGAHVADDLFRGGIARLALLNFPVHALAERLERGPGWSRDAWARSRMMDRFDERVPAEVTQEIVRTVTRADQYIAGYNIRMDRLVTSGGDRLFPEGLRLISHWGLRDELASHYAEDGGLERQRMILTVMERIVRQEIPGQVIDNEAVEWDPARNRLRPLGGEWTDGPREADERYARWLANFHALRLEDPYSPTAPTAIARSFDAYRQIPEKEVEALLVSVLSSPEVARLGRLISTRLGRPLEPFDIWYSGFKSRSGRPEAELDRIVRERYPSVAAFQADLHGILTRLSFAPERAAWLAQRIVVDPSRGAGHAMGAVRREDAAHLRTRVPAEGMNYKGYNIAIHELGHNVEQTFSLQGIDRWFLNGVPNNAFTEAFAFTFQARDLELLGLNADEAGAAQREALGALWATYEIGGVSLVDMRVWRWLYEHPDATAAELREAVVTIARDVWNAYFAPVFGVRDSVILAIYSHMVAYPLYLSDYALGHMIAFQVSEKLRGEALGREFERMARIGRVTPDLWMRTAVDAPISAEPLLRAARAALEPGT